MLLIVRIHDSPPAPANSKNEIDDGIYVTRSMNSLVEHNVRFTIGKKREELLLDMSRQLN